jgi:hypothetical protein
MSLLPPDPETVEAILETINYCCDVSWPDDEPCYHCRQKLFLLNVICAGLAFCGPETIDNRGWERGCDDCY